MPSGSAPAERQFVEEDLFLGVTEDPIMTKKYSFQEANSS